MKKLWVKIQGADGNYCEVVFHDTNYSHLNEMLIKAGLGDFKVIDWKVKNMIII